MSRSQRAIPMLGFRRKLSHARHSACSRTRTSWCSHQLGHHPPLLVPCVQGRDDDLDELRQRPARERGAGLARRRGQRCLAGLGGLQVRDGVLQVAAQVCAGVQVDDDGRVEPVAGVDRSRTVEGELPSSQVHPPERAALPGPAHGRGRRRDGGTRRGGLRPGPAHGVAGRSSPGPNVTGAGTSAERKQDVRTAAQALYTGQATADPTEEVA